MKTKKKAMSEGNRPLKKNAYFRKQQHQQLAPLIVEKKMEHERLRLQYETLLKSQEDQSEFIEQFIQQK